MHFDLSAIPPTDAYKLLVSTVVPRPIAGEKDATR
jgi:hypothetical protein